VRGLEWYELGGGEVIVNVTDHEDVSEVTSELGKLFTWDFVQVEALPDEDGEGATEWLTLIGARRSLTATRPAA
jgi:hypothetical protein